jgi:hypothetical protein
MYLVDANILIEAKNRYYAFDIAPGFWIWLEQAFRGGLATSIEAVRDELMRGDDELATWAGTHKDHFRPIDQRTTRQFGPLSAWVTQQQYKQSAINEFSSDQADYLLIAHARAHGYTVTTLERPSPGAKNRVRIPDACAAMDVPIADTFTMMRATGAQLHLSSSSSVDEVTASPTLPGL